MWPAVKLTAEQLGYKFDCDGRAGRMNITIAACQRQGEKQGLMNSGVWPIQLHGCEQHEGLWTSGVSNRRVTVLGWSCRCEDFIKKNILQFELQIFRMRGV